MNDPPLFKGSTNFALLVVHRKLLNINGPNFIKYRVIQGPLLFNKGRRSDKILVLNSFEIFKFPRLLHIYFCLGKCRNSPNQIIKVYARTG